MMVLEEREPAAPRKAPALIVAPFTVHEASIADFAEGHSLAQALAEAGSGPLALTYWKSATADMRDYGIDAYLGDLNIAIDDLGGRVSLVGLCQGGWLAAAYAARFPAKVPKLALAGAPIDLDAAESDITRGLASVPPEMIANVVALGGGRVSGSLSLALWSDDLSPEFTAESALQCAGNPPMMARFNAWNLRTVDLPAAYFVRAAEWVFRENRLARGRFLALGRSGSRRSRPRFSSLPRRTTRSCRSPRRQPSDPSADRRAWRRASNPEGTCRCSWAARWSAPPGGTSGIGSRRRRGRRRLSPPEREGASAGRPKLKEAAVARDAGGPGFGVKKIEVPRWP